MTLGTRLEQIPVAIMATGASLTITIHEVSGARRGPILGLSASIHGDEIIGTEVLRRVLSRVKPEELSGTLRVLPAANPLALEGLSRNTPLDMTNMNRVFPGDPNGMLTERLAHVIVERFIKTIEYYVDLHAGGALPVVDYAYLLNSESLSRAFGLKVLYRPKASYTGSSSETSLSLGIPTVVVELGGGPNIEEHIERGVEGIMNVMRTIGMLPGSARAHPEQVVITAITTIRPAHGGLMVPELPVPELGSVVLGKRVLARVYNPATLEEIEVLSAPFEQNLMILQRETLTRVNPGDYGFMIADAASVERL